MKCIERSSQTNRVMIDLRAKQARIELEQMDEFTLMLHKKIAMLMHQALPYTFGTLYG